MEEKMMKYIEEYLIEKGIDNPEDLTEKDYNNIMNTFFENHGEEILEELDSFSEREKENPDLVKAYDKLDKAYETKNKKTALKYAKEAYKISNECFDAILLQCDLEDNFEEKEKILRDGLKIEEKRLKKEGYFEKDCIGRFYGMLETRSYMRGLYKKAMFYLESGKIKLSRDVCLEILKLNENDNMGARYLLMAIYAYLEEEKPLVSLFKKYREESLSTLFPMMALYYKLGNIKKAKEYLEKIKNNNKSFVKFFKEDLENDGALEGYYSIGGSSEVIMYMNNYEFLIYSMPYLPEFVLGK